MNKWRIAEMAAETVGFIAAMVGFVASFQISEDLDDQIQRVIDSNKEEEN